MIGKYKLLQKLGEGGMGVVWAAEQCEPVKRRVALKVIKPGMDSRKVVARLQAERQALALMDHSNIAKVFDAGATGAGRPYFVMELVRGLPITRYCDEMQLSLRERLELFLPVCHAIQHAHQKGIIHRDIKPSNVLVAVEEGKPMPKVIDFGVAKALHQRLIDQSIYTEIGQVIGTLEYMSPEQAELNVLDVDTRADIYALGALVYELLTGTTPLDRKRLGSQAYPEMLRLIREESPQTPSTRLSRSKESAANVASLRRTEPARLAREMRGDLDWIVMKCLEKDRTRRYATADALALDIRRFLDDEPVEARPPSRSYRLRKFVRRHAAAMWAIVACVTLLVAGTVTSTIEAVRAIRAENGLREEATHAREAEKNSDQAHHLAETARAEEAQARGVAERQERLARRRLYASQVNLAYQALRDGDPARTLELLEGQRPFFDQEDLRTFEWYYLWEVCHRGRLMSWSTDAGQVMAMEFSKDEKTLATAGWDGLRIWGLLPEKKSISLTRFLPLGNVWALAFSPDGKTLVSAGTGTYPKSIRHWDVRAGKEWAHRLGILLAARAVAYSSDGKSVAGGGGDEAKIWDAETGQEVATIPKCSVRSAAFSPKGGTLALGCDFGIIRVWTVTGTEWKERFVLHGHTDSVKSVAFSPDGVQLASSAREIKLWDMATGNEHATLQKNNGVVADVKFSPDGKTLASGADDRYVRLWDIRTCQMLRRYAHVSPISRIAFSSEGNVLAAATYDGMIHLWDLSRSESPTPMRHSAAVSSANFANDDSRLIAVGGGKSRVWDSATGKELDRLEGSDRVLALSQDGKMAVFLTDGVVSFWEAPTGRNLGSLAVIPKGGRVTYYPKRLLFSADAKLLAAWNPDPKDGGYFAQICDVDSRTWRTILNPSPKFDVTRATCVAFSPDGSTLAVGYQYWWVVIYDTDTGRVKRSLALERESLGIISALAYSRDGRTLATGTEKGAVRLWDAESEEVRVVLKGHATAVRSIAFSPDGNTIATAADDGTVRLWDSLTGQERLTLTGHAGPVSVVTFSHNGRILLSAGADGEIRLWHASSEAEAIAPRSELDRDDAAGATGLEEAGENFEQAGRTAEAENAYRSALVRYEKLAAVFPQVLDYWRGQAYTLSRLGTIYQTRKDHNRAAACFADALTISREKLGPDDPAVGRRLISISRNLIEQEKFSEAIPHLRECLDLRARIEPETYGHYYAEYLLGRCLLAEKKFAEAEPLLLDAFKGLTDRKLIYPSSSPRDLRDARSRIVELYEAVGDTAKAAEWRKQD
jgi:WD40 repeat protein/serine/threonine protein kinase